MKFVITFIGTAVLFLAFFYFYPAEIFESVVEDVNGTKIIMDLSIKSIFFGENIPESLVKENISNISLTTAGWLILFICNFGLPLMIAYRTTVARSPRPKRDESE